MKLFQLNLQEERIFGLDMLRFCAILLVLISHGRHLLHPIFESTDFMSIGGYWGVELFFVLSGFLIGGILIKNYEKEERFNMDSVLYFWKRRWFRTLPNYYLILLVNILVAIFIGRFDFSDWRYYSFLIFFQNFISEHPSFFGEAWSLAVEEWFYISFPIILLICTFLFPSWFKKQNKILLCILLVFFFCLLMKIAIVINYNPHWDDGIRKIVPLRLDSILIGVLFSWFKFYYPCYFDKHKRIMLLLSFLLIISSAFYYYVDINNKGLEVVSFFGKTFYFNLTSISFGFLLPFFSADRKKKPKGFFRKWTTIISLVSYSMYLIHFSFILRLMGFFAKYNTTIISSLLLYGFYFCCTLFLSVLLYKYFEKPMTQLREFTPTRKSSAIREYTLEAVSELKRRIIK